MRPLSFARQTVALVALTASVATAQGDALRPGMRVRVTAPGVLDGRLTATVITRTTDSLTLASEHLPSFTVALARIATADVSQGRSRSAGAARGVLWSVPVGIVGGLAAERATRRCGTCHESENLTPFHAALLVSALCGAGIGALLGREQWEPISLERVVGFAPLPAGALVRVRWTL